MMLLANRIRKARGAGRIVITSFEDGQLVGPNGLPVDHQYDSVSDTGYYGLVTTADLIAGDELATEIGLTVGVSQYSAAGWFKFYVGPDAVCNRNEGDPYVCYIARTPYRHSVSWFDINAVSAVYGERALNIKGLNYKVRLLTGSRSDPYPEAIGTSCTDDPGAGSEWNELFYRIHADTPACSSPDVGMPGGYSSTRHGGPQSSGSNWAAYTDTETAVYSAVAWGTSSWAMETQGTDTSRRASRGFSGVARWNSSLADYSSNQTGWRPVLEFIS